VSAANFLYLLVDDEGHSIRLCAAPLNGLDWCTVACRTAGWTAVVSGHKSNSSNWLPLSMSRKFGEADFEWEALLGDEREARSSNISFNALTEHLRAAFV